MTSSNNSVGRLYHILQDFRDNSNGSVAVTWAKVFGIEPDDGSALAEARVQVYQLIIEAKEDTKSIPNHNQELLMRPFINVQRVMNVALGENAATVKSFLDDATMQGLEYVDDILSRMFSSGEISPEQVAELQKKVEDLRNRVSETELPADLKGLLLFHLAKLARVLRYYRLYGVRGVQAAAVEAMGVYAVHVAQERPGEPDIAAEEVAKDYVILLREIVSVTADVMQIMLVAKDYLPPLLEAIVG